MDTTSEPIIQDDYPWDGKPLLKSDDSSTPQSGTPSTTEDASSHDKDIDNDIVEASEVKDDEFANISDKEWSNDISLRLDSPSSGSLRVQVAQLQHKNRELTRRNMELEERDIERQEHIIWLQDVWQGSKQAHEQLRQVHTRDQERLQELEQCLRNVFKSTSEILNRLAVARVSHETAQALRT